MQYPSVRRGRNQCYKSSDEFQPEAGKTECIPCPNGQLTNSNRTASIECPEGEAVIDGVCHQCPPGVGYDEDGYCDSCETGSFKAKEGVEACVPCPPNSFSMRGSAKCTRCCRAGKALMRNGKCGSCVPGSFYDDDWFRYEKCEQGDFQPYENVAKRCFSCSGDTKSMEGATMCTKCPLGEVPRRRHVLRGRYCT